MTKWTQTRTQGDKSGGWNNGVKHKVSLVADWLDRGGDCRWVMGKSNQKRGYSNIKSLKSQKANWNLSRNWRLLFFCFIKLICLQIHYDVWWFNLYAIHHFDCYLKDTRLQSSECLCLRKTATWSEPCLGIHLLWKGKFCRYDDDKQAGYV